MRLKTSLRIKFTICTNYDVADQLNSRQAILAFEVLRLEMDCLLKATGEAIRFKNFIKICVFNVVEMN